MSKRGVANDLPFGGMEMADRRKNSAIENVMIEKESFAAAAAANVVRIYHLLCDEAQEGKDSMDQ